MIEPAEEQSETGGDTTNYWLFTKGALERLFQRTGWDLLRLDESGCAAAAEPDRASRDKRVFCLLRSALADPWYRVTPDSGLFEPENGWRWTAARLVFTVEPHHQRPTGFELDFAIHASALQPASALTLRTQADGVDAAAVEYRTAGAQQYRGTIPQPAESGKPLRIAFTVDPVIHTATDRRDLGVILSGVTGDYGLRLRFE